MRKLLLLPPPKTLGLLGIIGFLAGLSLTGCTTSDEMRQRDSWWYDAEQPGKTNASPGASSSPVKNN